MATERNPFDKIEETISNVIELPEQLEKITDSPSIEPDEDGGVTVDFTQTSIEMNPESETEQWYGNIADTLDDESLTQIAEDTINNYTADKDSRAEWESMFERGFDLLGLKIEDASEPFEGACTAVHPMLIESAVKFQSKAIQESLSAV